MVKGVVHPPI